MSIREKLVLTSINHPKGMTLAMVLSTFAFAALIPFMGIKVDTDPENMLSEDEAHRVFHRITKKEFTLHDYVVVGIVNEEDPDGVFNPESLRKVKALTDLAHGLPVAGHHKEENWIVKRDIIAPSEVDDISQGEQGELIFSYLMKTVPETRDEARRIRDAARDHPLLYGTMLSEDEKALCLYIPLTEKNKAYKVAEAFRSKFNGLEGPEQYFITGLPIAEDQFGVEMFIQMAISAPGAMIAIFILMLIFFRKLILIISPLIIAMVSVISTMGLMISMGYTVHIMSSMIPIFLMPIAVVDSVHILSEFFDRYQLTRNRRETCRDVIRTLFMPMLYTSLTSAAGFASLALTPIPPVQVFGIFVAFGILVAWLWTILFIPAYIMFIPEKRLENFGLKEKKEKAGGAGFLSRFLFEVGRATSSRPGIAVILTGAIIIAILSGIGISTISVNDNPVKWFEPDHEIRIADEVLNEHFGGTYLAYLILGPAGAVTEAEQQNLVQKARQDYRKLIDSIAETEKPGETADATEKEAFEKAYTLISDTINETAAKEGIKKAAQFQTELKKAVSSHMFEADFDVADALDIFWTNGLENQFRKMEIFKSPDVLKYMDRLQEMLIETGIVGKTNSMVQLVKKIHQELKGGEKADFIIPHDDDKEKARRMVADCLMQVQNSHNPDDLWQLVTQDYSKGTIWIQLKSGDNKDMEKVTRAVDRFFNDHPPEREIGVDLSHKWAGLTYINVVWQDKMVKGMLQSFLGSFLVVFFLMMLLFRSPLWGLLSMIPLSITIAAIYGVIGLVGKDYDMPVAVLSALTLGIAVDFAIHFLERSRSAVRNYGSWRKAVGPMFDEPARAIARNVIVIAIGFTPLLLAPLVPYQTVGIFLASILAISGLATILILPVSIHLLQRWLFKEQLAMKTSCSCVLCVTSSVVLVAVVALNIHQYALVQWSTLTWISLIAIPILMLTCNLMSQRESCKTTIQVQEE